MGPRDRLGTSFIVAEGLLLNLARQGRVSQRGEWQVLTDMGLGRNKMTFFNWGNYTRLWKRSQAPQMPHLEASKSHCP